MEKQAKLANYKLLAVPAAWVDPYLVREGRHQLVFFSRLS